MLIVSGVFLLALALPGDIATQLTGADHAAADALRARFHLDEPWWRRLGYWWWAALQGDLGVSWLTGTPVAVTVWGRLLRSLVVVVPAWVAAMILGVSLALYQAAHQGRRRAAAANAFAAVVAAIPEAVIVVLLIVVVAVRLQWLPAVSLIPAGQSPWHYPRALVLPVVALALPVSAWVSRMVRGPAEELFRLRLYTAARRRGRSTHDAMLRIVVVRLLPVVIQTAAISGVGLLSSGVVVEALVNYPGLGGLLAHALGARDVPVIQGIAVVISTVAIATYALADVSAGALARKVSR
ncbi:ABC transporter permease [Corynebacterium sp. 13CS0277]|uniref:ABC transporter permease n=1 Tax=Corynebacterium sp. 13CS0277 TaxID=2071994 RepID=UPI0013048889|nr:ABC transporter permease [Corynebacterium sp. 13CS0277]